MRIVIDCDSFWDEYLLPAGEEPPDGALLKTVSVGGDDRTAVRFIREHPSRTYVSVGDVEGSHADYLEGHRLAGRVPKWRDQVEFLVNEHLAEVLSHHAAKITAISADDPAVSEYLQRRYGVPEAPDEPPHLADVLPNHEKREHMQRHYAAASTPAPRAEVQEITPDDVGGSPFTREG